MNSRHLEWLEDQKNRLLDKGIEMETKEYKIVEDLIFITMKSGEPLFVPIIGILMAKLEEHEIPITEADMKKAKHVDLIFDSDPTSDSLKLRMDK